MLYMPYPTPEANMLKPQVHRHHSKYSTQSLLTRWHKVATVAGDGITATATSFSLKNNRVPIKNNPGFHIPPPSRQITAVSMDKTREAVTTTTKVKAVITVQVTLGGLLSSIGLTKGLDDITDLLGKSILLELVAAHVDHRKSFNTLHITKFKPLKN